MSGQEAGHGPPTPGSWLVEVKADSSGKWVGNALRFTTREGAETYAVNLYSRWMAVREWRVRESADPPNRGVGYGPL